MIRQLRTISAALVLALAAVTAPASASVQDDVVAITISALNNGLGISTSVISVNYVSVIGQWGFTSWTAGEGGGDTIMEQVNGYWTVLGQGQGQMNSVILVHFGVPQATAASLLFGSCPPLMRRTLGKGAKVMTIAVRRTDSHGKHIDTVERCPQ